MPKKHTSQEPDLLAADFAETFANAPKPEHPFRSPVEADLWRPVSIVALFIRAACPSCGMVSSVLENIYVKRIHARTHCEHLELANLTVLPADLPRFRQYLDREVPFCSRCIPPTWKS